MGEDSAPPERAPLGRLPSGRHGLPRNLVSTNHRERLIAACAQTVPERGYGCTTVADIIKAAAVSRRTFYEYFDGKEACFLATYDLVISHLRERMTAAFEAEAEWPASVRAALAAMLGFFAEEPALARICLVEPLAAGPPIAEHHRQTIESFTPFLEAGREPGRPGDPPPDTEAAVVAGMAMLITGRVVAGEADRLQELLPGLLETALAPFLGAAEAERIGRQSPR
jgi:AcrR family transcriptional regulator